MVGRSPCTINCDVIEDGPDAKPRQPVRVSVSLPGVGRMLVERVISDATAIGAERLHLITTHAERYYEPLAFRVLERRRYRGFDAAIMGRDLRA